MKRSAAPHLRELLALGLATLVTLAAAQALSASPDSGGIVIEEVATESTLARAGLEAGDVLLTWRRLGQTAGSHGAGGRLETPFDWDWLAVEQAPRGRVVLEGERNGEPLRLSVAPGWWQSDARPRLSGAVATLYRRGQDAITDGRRAEGLEGWDQAAEIAGQEGDQATRSWLLLRLAEERSTGAIPMAREIFETALAVAPDLTSRAKILEALGDGQVRRDDFDGAESSYLAALDIWSSLESASLSVAKAYRNLGVVAWTRDRFPEAEKHYRRALEIRQALAPDSLAVASSLNNLGILAFRRGDLQTAADYHHQALAIRERLAPKSPVLAGSLTNLGNVLARSGDLAAAGESFQSAFEIFQRTSSSSRSLVTVLNSLGVVAHRRGELGRAMDYYQQALELQVETAPGTYMHAGLLNNLGVVAHLLGELDLAADHQSQALAIQEKVTPGSLYVAESLAYLAAIATERGETDEAIRRHTAALEIRRQLAPSSLAVAESLVELARLAMNRGEATAASRYLRDTLEIQERLAPHSVHMATTLDLLGRVTHQQGDLKAAAEHLARALAIWEDLAPRSAFEAETLHALGGLYEDSGQPGRAVETFDRAIAALEAQIVKLAGSQDRRGRLRARHSDLYRDAVRLHVDLGSPERAFHVMERFRGQSFLTLLAERDLLFSADISEDLERDRRFLAIEHDQIQKQLDAVDPTTDPEKFEALSARLRSHFERRDMIVDAIREASPRLGAIRYPQALNLSRAREALDQGTVMLAYSVGRDRTELFVVTRESGVLGIESLGIGAAELEGQVRKLRRLLSQAIPGSAVGAGRLVQFEATARLLYEQLLAPAAGAIEAGERVLILPDGPLHLLPFSSLIRDAGKADGGRQYVAEWKPLHFALSATVYAELATARRPPPETPRVVAFGDPTYTGDPDLPTAIHRDLFEWGALPHTRREVLQIANLFEGADIYVGDEATEERAKSLSSATNIVHFATHSHLDDRFPLSSALVLTLPEGSPRGRENGLLHAWEIFEQVRLDADLVVLSACQSALGKEQAGEGLLGLSRAFQYAGARTVAATLWSVADQTTPELMRNFYRHLDAGMAADEALQAAQIELIRGPIDILGADGRKREMDASAPFYWAAFQIFGDWR